MRHIARCAALAIWLVALALPAGAAADRPSASPLAISSQLRQIVRERSGRNREGKPSQLAVLQIKTGRGYVVQVVGSGRVVAINVVRGDSNTTYVVRGTAEGRRLQGNFGSYGKVSMRFRPSRHDFFGHDCGRGRKLTISSGVYVGRVRFHGEGGYLDVDAHRARGGIISVDSKCPRRHSSSQAQVSVSHPETEGFFGPETPVLEAGWRQGVRGAEVGTFFLFANFVYAKVEESRGRMAIFRSADVITHSNKFLKANDALTSARLSPPPPFSGSGIYTAGPDGKKTWTGSLAVDFPGAPNYPLTGPPFKATLGKE